MYPDLVHRPDAATVKLNCARFGRLMFGSVSEMHLRDATDEYGKRFWEIKILSEGHPVHDPQYTEWMHGQWRRFLKNGFGLQCAIHAHARLEAGDREDGRPADQLIILPPLSIHSVIGE